MTIPQAELATRRERAVQELQTAGLDALVVQPGTNFRYLTGLALERSERLVALVLQADGGAWMVGPAFEEERLAPAAGGAYHAWAETEDPFRLLGRGLGGASTVGLGPTTWFVDAERLASALPSVHLTSAHELLGALRMRRQKIDAAQN